MLSLFSFDFCLFPFFKLIMFAGFISFRFVSFFVHKTKKIFSFRVKLSPLSPTT